MIKKVFRIFYVMLFLVTTAAHAENWEKLFDDSVYQNAKISPDGKHLAVSMLSKGKMVLVFLDRETKKVVGNANFRGDNEVGSYQWVNNERVVINVYQRLPWLEFPVNLGELFAINYDGSRAETIYGYQAGVSQIGSRLKKKESIYGWAEVIDVLPEDKRHILVSSTPQNSNNRNLLNSVSTDSDAGDRIPSVLKLNVYTGVVKQDLGKGPVPFARFLTDTEGEVRAVVGTDENNRKQLYVKNGYDWQKVSENVVGYGVTPLSISASGKYMYTIDNKGQDLHGIFKLDLEDFSYKSIFTDKTVDVTNVEMTTDGRSAFAIRLDEDYPNYLILNKKLEEAQIFKDLLAAFPYSKVSITSKTQDGNFYIVYVSSDVDPGQLYIFDKEKNKLALLFKFKPDLKSSQMVQVEPIKFAASDGTVIRGYFTPGKTANKTDIAPVVVMVHGGPVSRDYWGFSSQAQYLALNGYSVLKVNYRGSDGFGDKFQQAGYQAWGTAIQQDIHEALQWLVSQKKATAGNACIMGGSFGGYSAIQSSTLYPNTYKCAIANAGIYDLELMFDEGDIQRRQSGLSYLQTVLGTDKQQLKSMSPVNYANKINVPVLLSHGEDDERAPFEHALRLKAALDKANKSYEWFAVDKEGHGFYNAENQKAYMKKVLSFLNTHLKS